MTSGGVNFGRCKSFKDTGVCALLIFPNSEKDCPTGRLGAGWEATWAPDTEGTFFVVIELYFPNLTTMVMKVEIFRRIISEYFFATRRKKTG